LCQNEPIFRPKTPQFGFVFFDQTHLAFCVMTSGPNTYVFSTWLRFAKSTLVEASPSQPCPESLSGRSLPAAGGFTRRGGRPLRFFLAKRISNNYRPYTTTATPRPAKISIVDN
jgi:hypothetical protein